jgi:cysteine desulfurase family protein (TIGR01976 family)
MKDVGKIRSSFPALKRKALNGKPAIYFDGPGASQMPNRVYRAYTDHVLNDKANAGGYFETSVNTTEAVERARIALALFMNCEADEIVLGANATTSIFQFSRAISRDWTSEDEVVVTKLDHFANVSPWAEVAKDKNCKITSVGFDLNTGEYNLADFEKAITNKTKIVAVNYACNAIGTINPIKEITKIAHAKGAMVFVDAVHYAPHGLIDVQDIDCDFLVTSVYKYFGPHISAVFAKKTHLENFEPYKVEPASDDVPNRWETGTPDFSAIAAIPSTIKYIISLSENSSPTRKNLELAYENITEYENELSRYFLNKVWELKHVKVHGVKNTDDVNKRTPTFGLTIKGKTSHQVAEYLAKHGIFAWSGHFYALDVVRSYNLEKDGLLRIGLLHYNTKREIKELISVLKLLY